MSLKDKGFETFKQNLNKTKVKYLKDPWLTNIDEPEAGLDALMQVTKKIPQ